MLSGQLDADTFSSRADRLVQLLGNDLVNQEVALELSGVAHQAPLGVFDIRRALTRIQSWKVALREGTISDPQDLLRFAMIADVAVQASTLPGSAWWLQKLRDSLASGSLDQFEETLFEGEVALYCQDQMSAVGVRFGPPSGQPDVFADLDLSGSRLPFAIECKRIQPASTESREFNMLVNAFERTCEPHLSSGGGLKAIIWMHRVLEERHFAIAQKVLEHLVNSLPAESPASEWRTASDPNGWFQVSIARLGAPGILQSGAPSVSDVPAEPITIARSEMVRVTEGAYHARVKSVLSIRLDRLSGRIGNLRDRLGEAMEQLRIVSPPRQGIVTLRIRPPRGLGDLWEADWAVRDMLSRYDSEHVALVVLFWEEQTEQRSTPDEEAQATRLVLCSLKPYFIANEKGIVRFEGIDSRVTYFREEPEALYRDPNTGQVVPVALDDMAAIERGADLPELLRNAISTLGDREEEHGAVTFYWSLREILAELVKHAAGRMLIGGVGAGRRHFRVFMDGDANLRSIEVRDRRITQIATIDLRAWLSKDELHLVLSWERSGFQMALTTPDELGQSLALSSSVRSP